MVGDLQEGLGFKIEASVGEACLPRANQTGCQRGLLTWECGKHQLRLRGLGLGQKASKDRSASDVDVRGGWASEERREGEEH